MEEIMGRRFELRVSLNGEKHKVVFSAAKAFMVMDEQRAMDRTAKQIGYPKYDSYINYPLAAVGG
jgi:hypothetical protein